jgi:anti-anti-sigma factor
MELKTHAEENALVVVVTGKMDAITAPAYVERIRKELAGGALRLVVDCAGLDYVSSAGLRAILTISKDLRLKGGTQAYCSLQAQVKEIFEISGFASMIPIHDTRDAALAALATPAAHA